jgi:molecular chaperone DnaK
MQTSVRISVYQGENPLAADNIFLGDFELVDIKPEPRGVPQIEVSFDIDANGILRVRAQDKETRKVQQIRIEPNSGLKDEQIKAMIEAAKGHAAANVQHSEAEQYRLTCRKLIEECSRELNLPGLGVGVDRAAGEAWLNQVAARLEGEDAESLKASLRELNQFVLRLRLSRPPKAADEAAPESGGAPPA